MIDRESGDAPAASAPVPWVRLALLAVPALLFAQMWPWMWDRHQAELGYFGHGPLVIPVVLVWLVARWRRDGFALGGAAWPALLLAAPAALGLFLVAWRDIGFAGGIGWWLATGAMAIAAFGHRAFLSGIGPWGFLLFMIPWPRVHVEGLAYELKFLAMRASLGLLGVLGIDAARVGEGSRVLLPDGGSLVVGEVCSGLRSVVALLAFGWLIAALVGGSPLRRGLVFLGAIPVALATNAARIALLIGLASVQGPKIAQPGSWVHDGSGFLVFVVAAVLLYLGARFRRGAGNRERPARGGRGSAPLPRFAWSVAVMALLSSGLVATWIRGESEGRPAVDIAALLPRRVDPLVGHDLSLAPGTQALLRADQVVYRGYGPGAFYRVCIVHGRDRRTRIHAPEVCYRGDGFDLAQAVDRSAPVQGSGIPPTVRELDIGIPGERWLVWYWFRADGVSTASYEAFEWRSFWTPEAGQTLVRLSVAIKDGGPERARERLEWLLRSLSGPLSEILTAL